jgi:protein-L-isoaspartate(D-aspartate) O-methyltransferase
VSKHDFSAMRAAMVDSQLRTNEVSEPRIVAALNAVPRENFVPPDRAALAYVDVPIPLGQGRSLNAPLVTARLLAEAQLRPGEKVLLIGSATGYAAALIAALGNEVVAVEEDTRLIAIADAALGQNSLVTQITAPLSQGAPAGAPYDVLFIDGAVECISQPLIDQLAERARVVTALVDNGVTRLSVGQKAGGTLTVVPVADLEATILPGFSKHARFTF